jgi:predicted RNA-binding protein associated with RNAse of E/G family
MLVRKPVHRAITIVYRRLPNDIREFPGTLLEATPNRLVIESPIEASRPLMAFGNLIADKGFVAIWFIYRNRWYDVGKFYDKSKNWIGYYCDILRPVRKLLNKPARTTVLTDLFLDLWVSIDGRYAVLDEDELNQALLKHEVSVSLARQARTRMKALVRQVDAGRFPPKSVRRFEFDNSHTNC